MIIYLLILLAISTEVCYANTEFDNKEQVLSSVSRLSGKTKVDSLNSIIGRNKESHPDLAMELSNISLELAKKENYLKGEAEAFTNLGVSNAILRNYDSSRKYFDNSLSLFNSLNDLNGRFKVLNNIGLLYKLTKDYKNALITFYKVYDLSELLADEKLKYKTLCNFGVIYSELKDYNKSLNYLFKAYELAIKLKLKSKIAYTANILGNIYLENNNYKESLNYYNIVLQNIDSVNDISIYDKILNDIGQYYEFTNKWQLALEYFKKSLKTALFINDPVCINNSYYNLGEIYLKLNNLDSAFTYYNKSIQICRDIEDSSSLAELDICLAELFHIQKKDKLAIEKLNNANEYFSKENDNEKLYTIYNMLADIYTSNGNYSKSLIFKDKMIAIQNTIDSVNKRKIVDYVKVNYEAELEMDRLKNEADLQEKKAKLYSIIIIISIIIAISIVITLILFKNYKRNQSKLQTLVHEQKSFFKSFGKEIAYLVYPVSDGIAKLKDDNAQNLDLKENYDNLIHKINELNKDFNK